MPTRLKRPSILRQLGMTILLSGFTIYLGYNAVEGQYGFTSRDQMLQDITTLQSEADDLQAEIDRYKRKNNLFDPKRLDPDILTEHARDFLSMVSKDDLIVKISSGNN